MSRRSRRETAYLWYFQSDVRCETVNSVMPSALACSYMTFSISSETADVHSSRMAYCRWDQHHGRDDPEARKRTLGAW